MRETLYSIDGGLLLPATSFSLSPGAHTLSFQSRDNVLNLESLQTASLVVRPPLPPPTVSFLSPSGAGYEVEVKGVVPVLGTAAGEGLSSWLLEAAPGQNAASGYSPIASGTAAVVAAALGSWDATRLSGWQTLRLSAANSAGETASALQGAYVGDPSLLLELTKDLKQPSAVAVGPSGLIYVADTGNDRVQVFTANGMPSASFGGFSQPQGVATDLFGNIFVADTNAKRAVRLTSLGQQTLSIPVDGKPLGIAADTSGYIYVSDSDNAQILKFNGAGSRVQAFALPGGKPASLALDASGSLYAADSKKKRVVVFSPSGALVSQFSPGLDLPFGIAVATSGAFVAVSDRALARLVSLNSLGQTSFSFGGTDSGLSGPRGLALDAAGNLYLAERPKNRVAKIGPAPIGAPHIAVADKLVLLSQTDAVINCDKGGKLERSDHAALTILPGACADFLEASISTPTFRVAPEREQQDRKLEDAGYVSFSTGVVFGPADTSLRVPGDFAVPYDSAAITAAGIQDLALSLVCWNPQRQEWRWTPSRVDPATRTVHGRGLKLYYCKAVWKKEAQ